jgi:hypothetical protein
MSEADKNPGPELLEHGKEDKDVIPTVDPVAERRWVRKLDFW